MTAVSGRGAERGGTAGSGRAMPGVHVALVDFTRGRIVAGAARPGPADEVRGRADAALVLERGLGAYAVRD